MAAMLGSSYMFLQCAALFVVTTSGSAWKSEVSHIIRSLKVYEFKSILTVKSS